MIFRHAAGPARSLAWVVFCAVVSGGAGHASDAQFKRVQAPKSGERPRIDVQISEEEHAAQPYAGQDRPQEVAMRVPVPQPQPGPEAPRKGRYAWFWDKVSPGLESIGPARAETALAAVETGGVAAPRLQALQEIARSQGIPILKATIGTRVSPALALAVIAVESGGRVDAESGAGAQGLMQLMPDTAARFGVSDSFSPEENIVGGVKYLDWLMGEFGNDPILALAGYNAGEGSVRKHAGVPPFVETRDYVPKVLAAFRVARGLCKTPPELITDGCVFHVMN
ncbi:lytic transglycosylase domain-containing protein [Lutimaribacter marinistellae]|uniref:Lytic transglycosylase domain-containing protein n=1 Tax=Lutimaribacter marinistellae TaxID=1820329 RepID=A0ABV7TJR3_9RHOB